MKTLIAYRSKTGYTKKYAHWLAETLHCDCKEAPSVSELLSYDTVIYGGGLYMGKINGIKLITDNFDQLKNKQLILFAVGISPGKEEELETLWKNNLPSEEHLKTIKTFYLRGGFNYQKLDFKSKFLMYGLKKFYLERKENPTEDDKGMLAMYDAPQDFTDRSALDNILKFLAEQ